MNRIFGIVEALVSLTPGAQWTLNGDDYTGLNWLDEEQTQPTEQECIAEVARLQADYDALEYQRLRAPEYPPITDYLDGVAKADQAQIEAYITACQAVKAKYPKPDSV
jgi:tRNA A37 N6-isopentenylltransferase MiaA